MKKLVVAFSVTFFLSVCTLDYFQEVVAEIDEPKSLDDVEELLELDEYNVKEINLEQKDNENVNAEHKKKSKPNLTLKNFYKDDYDPCGEKLKQYNSLNKVIDDYIHRYVNLFLRVSLLKNHYVSSEDEVIQINFEISITGKDLTFLQQYANSSSTTAEKNLSKLDSIMMNIIRLKEKTIVEKSFERSRTFFESLLSFCDYELIKIIILIFLILIILLLAFKKFSLSNGSFLSVMWIVVNIVLFFEGWRTYKKKLKEKEVEMYVEALGRKEIPEDCDPSKISWYNSWYNYIFGTDCLQYHLSLSKVATDEVSIYQCIYDTYALYFIRKPFNFFGEAVRDFNIHLTDSVPKPFNLIVFVPISIFTVCIVALFFLVLCGFRLKISFFGSSLEVGKVSSSSGQADSSLFSHQLDTQPQTPSLTNFSSNSGTLAVKGFVSKPRIKVKRARAVSLEQRPKKLTV